MCAIYAQPLHTTKYIYLYSEAESPLRMGARLTAVRKGGIVLSVTIYIKSKDLYTIQFCRIGVWGDPPQTERCS